MYRSRAKEQPRVLRGVANTGRRGVPFTRISAERSRGKGEERGLPTPRLAAYQQHLPRVQRGAHRANSVARRTCGGEELKEYRSALDLCAWFNKLRHERLRYERFSDLAVIKMDAHRSGTELRHVVRHDHARRTLLHQQCGEGARTCGVESGERLVGNHQSGRGDDCGGDSRLCALSATEARHVAFRRVAREAGEGDRRVGTRRKKFGAHAARLKRERHII